MWYNDGHECRMLLVTGNFGVNPMGRQSMFNTMMFAIEAALAICVLAVHVKALYECIYGSPSLFCQILTGFPVT